MTPVIDFGYFWHLPVMDGRCYTGIRNGIKEATTLEGVEDLVYQLEATQCKEISPAENRLWRTKTHLQEKASTPPTVGRSRPAVLHGPV